MEDNGSHVRQSLSYGPVYYEPVTLSRENQLGIGVMLYPTTLTD
jgi:hypothetical protein